MLVSHTGVPRGWPDFYYAVGPPSQLYWSGGRLRGPLPADACNPKHLATVLAFDPSVSVHRGAARLLRASGSVAASRVARGGWLILVT
eukprot:3447642-Prymnesium_polylepis.1